MAPLSSFVGLTLILAFTPAAGWTQSATGGISGVVTDSSNTPLAATVKIAGFGYVPGLPVPVVTGADGRFSFSELPPGTYRLCATAATGGYVDGCLWHPGPVRVVSGTNLAGRRIVLETAGTLNVHILDPSGLMSNNAPGIAVSNVPRRGNLWVM